MKKTTIMQCGNKNHKKLDNLFTLSLSNNDVYGGVIDYIFFRVLNLEPIEYFNLTEQLFEEEFTDNDIDLCQKNYFDFEKKNNFSDKIKDDIEEVINFIRKKALDEKIIKEIIKNKYIEASYKYDAKYILKKIIKFYREK